ncbi:hypothetical protein [Leucobacter sp. W1478]|uniref:hypothetical protein n=1 Tax=Leucobacter sp. W1478 TaxID=3439065 RepID=UPI003F32F24C
MIDALVTGRSVAALLAALDLAEVGLRVGIAIDERVGEPPAAPVRDPDGIVAGFLNRVAAPIAGAGKLGTPGALPLVIEPVAPLLLDREGAWAPQPSPAVLGIPASPLSSEAVRLLGPGASLRAYLDRIMPLLAVGKAKTLGPLVRKRIGARPLERLIEPVIRERYGVSANEVDVALAAPGLNEALSRVGSLTGAALAYSERNVARETRVLPAGGSAALQAELLRKLSLYDAQLVESRVCQVSQHHSGLSEAVGAPGCWRATLSDGRQIETRSIILDFSRNAIRTEILTELAPELGADKIRVHAAVDISRPEWLGDGQSAIMLHGGWAVRLETLPGAPTRAHFTSAVLAEPPSLDGVEAVLSQSLTELGFSELPDAEWSTGVAAAPFATIASREQAESRVANLSGHAPKILAVGRSLFGDDLPVTLTAAHDGAVSLRRYLTGLIA